MQHIYHTYLIIKEKQNKKREVHKRKICIKQLTSVMNQKNEKPNHPPTVRLLLLFIKNIQFKKTWNYMRQGAKKKLVLTSVD